MQDRVSGDGERRINHLRSNSSSNNRREAGGLLSRIQVLVGQKKQNWNILQFHHQQHQKIVLYPKSSVRLKIASDAFGFSFYGDSIPAFWCKHAWKSLWSSSKAIDASSPPDWDEQWWGMKLNWTSILYFGLR